MEQYTGNQYDDDLTLGTDDYDDSYYSDADDLFAFTADEESPISRLKSLILSIDWEITDEILLQFNEELVDLKDIWAGEKINLIYVQALEKISKYIYHRKADSHPNAIKLLLTLYHNLEKIVSSPELTEEEKNVILIEDVRRFEGLKQVIGGRVQKKAVVPKTQTAGAEISGGKVLSPAKEELYNLKAIVLGIDWEITDKDLEELRQEVVYLEHRYAHSKPRLILLQGIGTLGAYIKLKKSNAHADAFKVLHFFYESLEKMVAAPMSLEQEKEILFPAVEEFNSFKALLGKTVDPVAIARNKKEQRTKYDNKTGAIAPALSDVPDEETAGFQAEKEARELGLENVDNVDKHVDGFFDEKAWEEEPEQPADGILPSDEASEIALQGVDVEEDDEEETDAPALRKSAIIDEPAMAAEDMIPPVMEPLEQEPAALSDEEVIPGVNVESEADDDSDEEPLPLAEGDLAPALAMAEDDGEPAEEEELFAPFEEEEQTEEEILSRVDGFFDDHDAPAATHWNNQDEALEFVNRTAATIAPEIPTVLVEEALTLSDSDEEAPGLAEETLEIEEDIEAFFIDTSEELPPGDEKEDEIEMFGDDELLEEPEKTAPLSMPEDDVFVESDAEDENIEIVAELEEPAVEVATPAFAKPSYVVPALKLAVPQARPAQSKPELVETAEAQFAGEPAEEPAELVSEDLKIEENLEAFFAETAEDQPFDEEEEVVFELVDDDISEDPGVDLTGEEEVLFEQLSDEDAEFLSALNISIGALGLEIENRDVQGMNNAVSELRSLMVDMPLEKTFLLLLSTCIHHIERKKPESDDECFVLLTSIYQALQSTQYNKQQSNQGRLLLETSQVLNWQEEMLAK